MSHSVALTKTSGGALAAADPFAREQLEAIGVGEVVLATIRRPRNLGHHRKFFALAHLAFQHWKPSQPVGVVATKSFERFRKDLVIAAGYYDVVLGLDGQTHLEAESLAFDRMDQTRFAEVYDAVLEVLTNGILAGMTPAQAERLAKQVWDEGF